MELKHQKRQYDNQKEFRREIRLASKLLLSFLRVNKNLFIVYGLITTLSMLVYLASLNFEKLISYLSASSLTPWGIITSIFVHGGGLWHLLNNLSALLFLFVLFPVVNVNTKTNTKRISISVFTALILTASITSTLMWVFLMPQFSTSGLSGVVYAAQGVVLALSLSNTLALPKIGKPVTQEKKRVFHLWSFNFVMLLCILTSIASNPDVFLSVAPRTNVFVHGVSFLSAFYSLLVWSVIPNQRVFFQMLRSKLSLK